MKQILRSMYDLFKLPCLLITNTVNLILLSSFFQVQEAFKKSKR